MKDISDRLIKIAKKIVGEESVVEAGERAKKLIPELRRVVEDKKKFESEFDKRRKEYEKEVDDEKEKYGLARDEYAKLPQDIKDRLQDLSHKLIEFLNKNKEELDDRFFEINKKFEDILGAFPELGISKYSKFLSQFEPRYDFNQWEQLDFDKLDNWFKVIEFKKDIVEIREALNRSKKIPALGINIGDFVLFENYKEYYIGEVINKSLKRNDLVVKVKFVNSGEKNIGDKVRLTGRDSYKVVDERTVARMIDLQSKYERALK